MSVPVFKEDALHNHVELITFHHDGEVELGFMIEVVPAQDYRQQHGLLMGPGFEGTVKLYSREGALVNTFRFGKDGRVKNGRLGSKPDADVPGMATLRTAGGENDPIYDGGTLGGVTITASYLGSGGGSSGVIITVPEGNISAPSGTLNISGGGGGGGGGGFGTASYLGQNSNGDYEYWLEQTPLDLLERISPQLNYMDGNVPDVRVDAFTDAVDKMLSNYQQNGTSSAQALEVGLVTEGVYAYVNAEIAYNGKSGSEIADQTAEIVDGLVGDLDAETEEQLLSSNPEAWETYGIDDKQLEPCMQSILTDLKKISQGVGSIVQQFAGDTPGYNWEMKDGSLDGQTAATDPQYDQSTQTVTTTFDSQAWSNATELSWARTILHEAVHAYLVAWEVNTPSFDDRIDTYGQLMQDYFASIDSNTAQHNEMARRFVNDIADALQQYGEAKGYSLSKQFYEDIAWIGLQETPYFNNLPSTDQQRILDVGAVELTGKDTSGNSKSQQGKNAGC